VKRSFSSLLSSIEAGSDGEVMGGDWFGSCVFGNVSSEGATAAVEVRGTGSAGDKG
jgi:hypothetical protein